MNLVITTPTTVNVEIVGDTIQNTTRIAMMVITTDGDDFDDADLEEHEKILDIKGMRRYLS
jgi:hypothetical protein